MTRRIGFVVYPAFDMLDLGGPVSVFNDANIQVAGAYAVAVVAAGGGRIVSSSGIAIETDADIEGGLDTLVVIGGPIGVAAGPSAGTLDLVRRLAGRARRITSVCAGAFVLQRAGLLDGKRATTHWKYAADLQARAPEVRVDSDKIFVRDGNVWTSAGGSAGIDLALAMVEDDHGLEVSRAVARGLVVAQRRLGGQSQYSALLELEPPSDRIRRALAFAREHLDEALPVARLAEAVSLSERQFARAFLAETGMSPAKAVERLRAETARPLVEEGLQPLDVIGRSVGFADPERMRQAFVRAFGQPPQALRRIHRARRTA